MGISSTKMFKVVSDIFRVNGKWILVKCCLSRGLYAMSYMFSGVCMMLLEFDN